MIIAGLFVGGLLFAAFLILIIGIRVTERHHGLRDPYGDGLTAALARKFLGVYVRQTEDPDRDHADCYGQVRR